MSSPAIDTGRVKNRRPVHYESYDDILADAERMASIPTRTLGNWSVGQIFKHLALAMDGMIVGIPFGAPRFMRWALRWFMMPWFLRRAPPSGFRVPKEGQSLMPSETTPEEGLELLRKAVARLRSTETRVPHPAFGPITREQWDLLQLRHCEMHMSFIMPVTESRL